MNEDTMRNKKGKGKRSQARMAAFQVLFQEDMNPGYAVEFGNEYIESELPEDEPLRIFAKTLVSGTRLHQFELDAKLSETAEHWSVNRMAVTDRNVLRMAVFELLYTDIPRPVVINEAVELAKNFGSKESAAFVNGILDKIRS